MSTSQDLIKLQTRRHFFRDCGVGVGAIALSQLMRNQSAAATIRQPPMFTPPAISVGRFLG